MNGAWLAEGCGIMWVWLPLGLTLLGVASDVFKEIIDVEKYIF